MWLFGPGIDLDKEAEKEYQRAKQRAREEWEWAKYEPGKIKMTREEAINKLGNSEANQLLLTKLEALGLIEFDEAREAIKCCGYETTNVNIRVEEWMKGYVLWYNGLMAWTSWDDTKNFDRKIKINRLTPSMTLDEIGELIEPLGYKIVLK